MEIVQGQTQFQDTYFVVGDYEKGPYRALRKLEAQVAEIERTMPAENDPRRVEAQKRLDNYAALRTKILECRPQSYWDAGFEAAESEYWLHTLAQKVALETISSGRPSVATLEALMGLPADLRRATLSHAALEVQALRIMGADKLYLGVASGE